MPNRNYKSIQTQNVIKYISEEYSVTPEFLWPERSPDASIFRNPRNRKWFGVIMVIPGTRLSLDSENPLEILDLKFDKGAALDFAECTTGIYPAYHMNKRNWITVALDDTINDAEIFQLIDKSFLLADKT